MLVFKSILKYHLTFHIIFLQRVAAGCGNPSNYMSYASELNGVMLTLDGGATWKMTNFPKSLHITDVVARAPAVIVASVRREVRMDITISNTNQRGIWVTNNNGESWSVKRLLVFAASFVCEQLTWFC